MAYAFKRDDATVEEAVRRIAGDLVEETLATLADDSRPLGTRIHEARKAVKKLRGLIRLVRSQFPDSRAELAALRTAAESVAALRDNDVLCTVFDRIARRAALPPQEKAALRAPFQAALDAARSPEALQTATTAFSAAFEKLATRIAGWRLTRGGFPALDPGLRRTWSEARTALKEAAGHTDPEAIHTLRKRVKDHWYQARLLAPIWPEMMGPHVTAADRLGEMLGDIHDLDVLAAGLADTGGPGAQHVIDAVQAEKGRLQATALPLARRLLAGSADDLADRWRKCWKVWRA